MRALCAIAIVASAAGLGCTPDWATDNSTPFIMEVAGINTGQRCVEGQTCPVTSIVNLPAVSDEVVMDVNIIRKNNNPSMSTSPVEHIYLERYEVRYIRSDGRNVEGVDVPYRFTASMGNVRFHTPGPGGQGEVQNSFTIVLVRGAAKLEPPLSNLRNGGGVVSLTVLAEVTVHARTIQGGVLVARGNIPITFFHLAG